MSTGTHVLHLILDVWRQNHFDADISTKNIQQPQLYQDIEPDLGASKIKWGNNQRA